MPGNPIPQSLYSNAYYHLRIACSQSVWPQFSPAQSHLVITQDVRELPQQEHKEAMCLAFGHNYILLAYVSIYNTYTLQYVLLQYNVFF